MTNLTNNNVAEAEITEDTILIIVYTIFYLITFVYCLVSVLSGSGLFNRRGRGTNPESFKQKVLTVNESFMLDRSTSSWYSLSDQVEDVNGLKPYNEQRSLLFKDGVPTSFCFGQINLHHLKGRKGRLRLYLFFAYYYYFLVVEFVVSAFDVLFLLMLDGLPEESRIFLKIIVTAYVLLAVFKNILLTKMANQLFLDKDIFRDADTYLSARFKLHLLRFIVTNLIQVGPLFTVQFVMFKLGVHYRLWQVFLLNAVHFIKGVIITMPFLKPSPSKNWKILFVQFFTMCLIPMNTFSATFSNHLNNPLDFVVIPCLILTLGGAFSFAIRFKK